MIISGLSVYAYQGSAKGRNAQKHVLSVCVCGLHSVSPNCYCNESLTRCGVLVTVFLVMQKLCSLVRVDAELACGWDVI